MEKPDFAGESRKRITWTFFFDKTNHKMKQIMMTDRQLSMERKIPLEKKMALAQYIRAENHGNRMKIRQRENILYGTNSQPPLFDKGRLQMTQPQYEENPEENGMVQPFTVSTFKYRMIVAIVLFVGFLLCDTGGDKIGSYTTNDIHEMITADTFHLYDGEGNDTMEALASLLDFK